ncbi:toll/interleukin-1 receptor domain-containing protein [Paractinoplanes toevensis]|uniref:TIR domain-containing protein n=1 Tax=Paractinoplanes toevensis TaxID=571911 RepID=A0A919WCF2_9ACTN|nr:toll/interleukin-1 receptor domain-containing protein [Actinoplanes toevensis]GIM97687.1 hypothetical protein Ato02nite_094800 [Actinoplanes toevensis]
MGEHVFISYAHDDVAYVRKLAGHLGDSGVPVWFDHSINAGDRWTTTIERQIEDCAVFVVVMSEAARSSKWVDREVILADRLGKPIMPLLLSGRGLLAVNNVQHHDVTDGRLPDNSFVASIRVHAGGVAVLTSFVGADGTSAQVGDGAANSSRAPRVDTGGVRLDGWAWWSKPAGTYGDYSILASNAAPDEIGEIRRETESFQPGTLPAVGGFGGFPWATFAATTGDSGLLHRVWWWDWTGDYDATGRPIAGALCLCLAADRPLSYEALAGYARLAWQRYLDDATVPDPAPGQLGKARAAEVLAGDALASWAASVAALTLSTPVRVLPDSDSPEPEQTARLFDAVAALLPRGITVLLQLSTGTLDDTNGPFAIVSGPVRPRPDDGLDPALKRPRPVRAGNAVTVRPGVDPDLSDWPESRSYRWRLRRLLERYSIGVVVRHLDEATEMPDRLGREATTAALAVLDSVSGMAGVGRDLVLDRAVDIGEVRAVVAGSRLAERVPVREHEAILRFLLVEGEATDLRAVAANWLPQLADVFVEVFERRAARGGIDESWLESAAGLVRSAGADDVLLPLLRRMGTVFPVPDLLARIVEQGIPADRIRQWLLSPDREADLIAAATGRGPDPLVRWLADDPQAPSWLRSLAAPDAAGARLPAADRATLDLMLLVAGHLPPPGLAAGSPYAGDRDYARRLTGLSLGDHRFERNLRRALPRALMAPAATEDALLFLDRMWEGSEARNPEIITTAVQVITARPELLDRPGAATVIELAAARDEHVRRVVAARDVGHAARADVPLTELTDMIEGAARAEVGVAELRAAFAGWPGAGDPVRIHQLVVELGSRLTGGIEPRRVHAGYRVVAPLLAEEVRNRLAARIREWAKEQETEFGEALELLREGLRRR